MKTHTSLPVLLRRVRGRLKAWRAPVALIVLVTLGLIEPLACVFHCHFWLPLYGGNTAAAHHHQHTPAAHLRQRAYHPLLDPAFALSLQSSFSSETMAVHGSASTPGVTTTPGASYAGLCDQLKQELPLQGVPFPTMPAPYHEMVVLMLVFGVMVLLTMRLRAPPLLPPRLVIVLPPFRPPIAPSVA